MGHNLFILTILEEIKKRFKFSQGSVTVLEKIANYQETRVKLTNTQLNKLKSAAKNKTRTILRLNKAAVKLQASVKLQLLNAK